MERRSVIVLLGRLVNDEKNKGLSDFIQKAMNTPDMIQRGKIHGSDSEIHSNLTREEIMKVLNQNKK